MLNQSQKEYLFRINKVLDFIEANLDKDLTVRQLADEAAFSAFHFHRIFSFLVGEPLGAYVGRKRIEQAARLLYQNPNLPISEVAEKTGFNSMSVFCRNFKSRFGMSAAGFRANPDVVISKNRQLNSKFSQSVADRVAYVCDIQTYKNGGFMLNQGIEIKEMSGLQLLYTRHVGDFHLIGQAYGRLFQWAGARGLLAQPNLKTVTVYHDDPGITEISKVRQSACITISQDVEAEGEFGLMALPQMQCVVGHFEIGPTDFQRAWDEVCAWLSESGFQPADGYPYELYHNDHEQHPEKKFIVDICIPVKPI